MDSRSQLVIAACLLLGLSGCYAPLEREHGYPADWPEPLPLSKGFPEIDGTYANRGTLFSTEGGPGEIALADLIPQRWTFGTPKGGMRAPNPPCADCVVLRMQPGTKWNPLPKLRATLPDTDEAREFDVEVASDEGVLLYLLQSSSSGGLLFGSSQTRVFLAVAADRSLIAKIHNEDAGLVVIVPYHSAKYAWARFERIGD